MPIDHFFRSLAKEAASEPLVWCYRVRRLMERKDAALSRRAGGLTFAQEESSPSMTVCRAVPSIRRIDFILAPKDIARELGGISRHPYVARVLSENNEFKGMVGSELDALFGLLRESSGVDFTNYKHTTLQRRIRRRMVVHKIEKLKDYVRFIGKKPEELDELYRDLLIHVQVFSANRKRFCPAQTRLSQIV